MHYFEYHNDQLCCDGISITTIAEDVGTPFYLYSSRTLRRHIDQIDGAFGDLPHITCYSVKANANLALLHIMASSGLGADIVSGGELYRARLAGFPPERIVYSGVGKTAEEIRYALREGIFAFNVESLPELDTINRIAGEMGVSAPVALRINPDVDPKTHPYISTGLRSNKFGIPHAWALDSFKNAAAQPHLRVIGVDAHVGSQIITVGPFVASAERLSNLVEKIRSEGMHLEFIDIGGGLGIRYHDETPPEPVEWASAIRPILKKTGCCVLFEPGRAMIGNVGVLVTRVLYVKRNEEKTFVIVDAAMNDLSRPMLYGSYHAIQPVVRRSSERIIADIVGPICESGDFFARDREVERVEAGDLFAIMSAGAYGFSMASNYNARPRVAEVLAVNGRYEVVRARETYEDLVRGERVLPWSD
ncbi:MAG: diaminopimelate decarboxylase [Candidatus Latescibacteria bacterium]|nr:diaminopimelate decarboxylase [Candidatus Latescibacterota bacterium]